MNCDFFPLTKQAKEHIPPEKKPKHKNSTKNTLKPPQKPNHKHHVKKTPNTFQNEDFFFS